MSWNSETLSTDIRLRQIEQESIALSGYIDGVGTITASKDGDGDFVITFSDSDWNDIMQVGYVILNDDTNEEVQLITDKTGSWEIDKKVSIANWTAVNFRYATQQTKINKAKNLLGDKIQIWLRENGYKCYVDESTENILDLIKPNEALKTAHDYLTLFTIYVDLSEGDNNYYKDKLKLYNDLWNEYLNDFLNNVDLDLDMDGDKDVTGERLAQTNYQVW